MHDLPTSPPQHRAPTPLEAWRRRTYEIVEVGRGVDRASRLFDAFIIAMIIASVVCFMLETVPSIEARYGRWLYAFEVVSVVVFTLEYAARIWTAVEVPFLKRLPPWKARVKFALRPYLIIDLLAILPFFLHALVPMDLRVLRVLRLLRLMKLSRYSPAMHTLIRVIYNERRSLSGAGLLLAAAVLLSATGMYYLEGHRQPDHFGSVPQATYWAVTTLTTVGYGDVTPQTPFGRLFAMFTMVVGLCILALPVAIVSTGFAQEVGRRDFVITWSLMSRIPAFADLDARDVALIMPLLHAQHLPPNVEVMPEGPGNAMYFVAAGEVEAHRPDASTRFGTGDFFGVVSMLEGENTGARFLTRKKSRLLKLHREDFARLEAAHPRIAEHIRKTARVRRDAYSSTRMPAV
ncbi:MAG: cyclic nucleotide-gated ion channel [Hyphomicrobiaceae bacterium]